MKKSTEKNAGIPSSPLSKEVTPIKTGKTATKMYGVAKRRKVNDEGDDEDAKEDVKAEGDADELA